MKINEFIHHVHLRHGVRSITRIKIHKIVGHYAKAFRNSRSRVKSIFLRERALRVRVLKRLGIPKASLRIKIQIVIVDKRTTKYERYEKKSEGRIRHRSR